MAIFRAAVLLCRVRGPFAGARRFAGSRSIFRKSTTFKLLTPNDKLAVYGIDDPIVEGIACHYTIPEKGGLSGALGLAEQTSDISLACNQYGPIKFKDKFSQGDVVFSESRSIFFKKMQIVRGCDTKRNILVYMTYSDKLVEGRRRIPHQAFRLSRGVPGRTTSRSARIFFADRGGQRESSPRPMAAANLAQEISAKRSARTFAGKQAATIRDETRRRPHSPLQSFRPCGRILAG